MKRQHVAALLLFTAVFSVLLLSSGISSTEMSKEWNLFQRGNDGDQARTINSINDFLQQLPSIPDTIVLVLFLLMLLVIPMLVVFAILSPKARQIILEEIQRAIPIVILIMAFAYLIFRFEFRWTDSELTPSPMPNLPDWITNPPFLLTFSIGVLLISSAVAVSWFLWQRLRGRGPLDELALEAQTTIDEIEAGADFTNAIVECYVRMCYIVRRKRRIIRDEGMTPREFAAHLEQFGLAGTQVQQLTRLFEKVRYSAASPTERDRREAVSCLEAIVYAASEPSSTLIVKGGAR